MMRMGRIAVIALVGVLQAGIAWAGAVDNKNNASAAYVRHLSRNAVVDSADCVALNPGGVTSLSEGWHIDFSNQTVLTDIAHGIDGREFGTTTPVPVLPHLYSVYRWDDFAAFFAFTIPGGGGSLSYDDGSAGTYVIQGKALQKGISVELSSHLKMVDYGLTFGGGYRLNDQLSFSLGVRLIYATQNIQMKTTTAALIAQNDNYVRLINHDQTAVGVGGILGVNYRPIEDLNLSLRWETPTRLEYEVVARDIRPNFYNYLGSLGFLAGLDPLVPPKGTKLRRDLPQYLGFGATYDLSTQLQVAFSFNYFIHAAMAQRDTYGDPDSNVWADDHRNGYEASVGVEYALNDRLTLSGGVLYSDPGAKPRALLPENPALKSYVLGTGAKVEVSSGIDINVGVLYNPSFSDTNPDTDGPAGSDTKVELLRKRLIVIAAGVSFAF